MSYSKSQEIFSKTLAQIKEDGLYKEERYICSPQGAEIEVRLTGESSTHKVVNLCSNNYLGLSAHPELISAAHQGLDERGFGMSSVRFICGTQDRHRILEDKMSDFLGTEDTILFSSCFDANAALFEALLTEEDAVFSDRLIHASLIDGIRLCKAKRVPYDHVNMKDLEEKLKTTTARIKMIVTDGVFSMDGDMAPLDELVFLAKKYEALLVVDESHATGFIGKTGRGTHEHFQVMKDVDIITTTFGKALGGATGGGVSAKKEVVAILKQKARPYLFSNALMPAVVEASLKALEVIQKNTERRDKLEKLSTWWRENLTRKGFDLKKGNTPIIPIMLYEAKVAQEFAKKLFAEGVYAVGFFYPVVPKGEARIRTQMSAALDFSHLEKALDIFCKVKDELKI